MARSFRAQRGTEPNHESPCLRILTRRCFKPRLIASGVFRSGPSRWHVPFLIATPQAPHWPNTKLRAAREIDSDWYHGLRLAS